MAGAASIVVLIAAGNSIGPPAEGIALLLGVDFIVDMARTGVNVIGNSLAAAVVDGSEKRREAKRGPGDVSAEGVTKDNNDQPRYSPGGDRRICGKGPAASSASPWSATTRRYSA